MDEVDDDAEAYTDDDAEDDADDDAELEVRRVREEEGGL